MMRMRSEFLFRGGVSDITDAAALQRWATTWRLAVEVYGESGLICASREPMRGEDYETPPPDNPRARLLSTVLIDDSSLAGVLRGGRMPPEWREAFGQSMVDLLLVPHAIATRPDGVAPQRIGVDLLVPATIEGRWDTRQRAPHMGDIVRYRFAGDLDTREIRPVDLPGDGRISPFARLFDGLGSGCRGIPSE